MEDELAFMRKNGVWNLVELPIGCKFVGCKWVFKTKRDVNGEVESTRPNLLQNNIIKGKA